MRRLKAELSLPLNFEMAATPEMLAIALAIKPHAVCLVPERREEVTTEGGLSVSGHEATLTPIVSALAAAGIRVSLFIDPDHRQLDAAVQVGAPVVELHTGAYAEEFPHGRISGLARLREAARYSRSLGLECHAGHGLTVDNVGPVAAIPEIVELNIGHFIVGDAIFVGLHAAIARMRAAIDAAATT